MDDSIGQAITALGGHQNLLVRAIARWLPDGYAPLACWAAGLKPELVTYVPGFMTPLFTVFMSRPFKPGDTFTEGIRYNGGLFFASSYGVFSTRPGDQMLIVTKGGDA